MRHLSAPGCNDAPMLAERSDKDLLSRFAATNDEAAFTVLIERHEWMMRSVCWHVLHHQHDAEDAFQQTLVVVMRKATSIHNGESFKSWLYEVAYSTAKDVRRSRRRRENHEQPCDLETQITQIDDELEQSELLAIIYAEVERLPEKYRFPFVLHCLKGKSETEIAAKLGLTKGMVAQRLRQARQILRHKLAHHGIEMPGQ